MMLNYLTLWRGYIFSRRRVAMPTVSPPHALSEWAAFRRSMKRPTPFRPIYH